MTASTSRPGGWSQAYENERKPPEKPPIHSDYFPTVYLQITFQSTVIDPAVHAPIRTIVMVDRVSSPARVIPTGDLQEL